MKSIASVLLAVTMISLAVASEPETYSIRLAVTGLEASTGSVHGALYASKKDYMRKALATLSATVGETEQVDIKFDGLPSGEYAITLCYDENDNGKLDTGIFKIPKEKFAFSNNAWRRFGQAKLKDARFVLKQSNLDLSIQMKRIRENK